MCMWHMISSLSVVFGELSNEIKPHCMHSKRANTGHMATKASGYINLVHYKTTDAVFGLKRAPSNGNICCLSVMLKKK